MKYIKFYYIFLTWHLDDIYYAYNIWFQRIFVFNIVKIIKIYNDQVIFLI